MSDYPTGPQGSSPRPIEVATSDAASPQRRGPFAWGFTVALGTLVAAAVALAIWALSSVVFNIVAALFLALSLNPLVNFLTRRGLSRGRAILVVVLAFALITSLVLALLLPPALRQGAALIQGLPNALTGLSQQPWLTQVNSTTNGGVDAVVKQVNELIGQPTFWNAVAGGVLALGAGIAGWVSSAVFIVVLTLYFLVSLKGMKRGFYSLISASKRHTAIYLTEKITDSIGRYIGGMVVLSTCNATFSFILLTLARVPFAGAIAFAAFFITLIPLIGTIVTTTIMTVVAFTASPTSGIVVLSAMLIYMQIEAYLMTPKAMGKALYIPGATVLISAMAGAVLMGFAGALIANPVAAAITLIVRHVVVPKKNAQ